MQLPAPPPCLLILTFGKKVASASTGPWHNGVRHYGHQGIHAAQLGVTLLTQSERAHYADAFLQKERREDQNQISPSPSSSSAASWCIPRRVIRT